MKASKNFKSLFEIKKGKKTKSNYSVDDLAIYVEMLDLYAPGTAKNIILKGEDIILPNDVKYVYQ